MKQVFFLILFIFLISGCAPNTDTTESSDDQISYSSSTSDDTNLNPDAKPILDYSIEDTELTILSKNFSNYIESEFEEVTEGPLVVAIVDIVSKIFEDTNFGKKFTIKIYQADISEVVITNENTIFFFTGIIPIALNESGIANMIAHEFGHFSSGHYSERLSFANEGTDLKGYSDKHLLRLALAVYLQNDVPGIIHDFTEFDYSKEQEEQANELSYYLMQEVCLKNPSATQNICDQQH